MAALRQFDLPAGGAICNLFSVNIIWLPLRNILTVSTHVPNIILQQYLAREDFENGRARSNPKLNDLPPHHCTAKSRIRDDSSLIGPN
jgi:hypothetical protein